MVKVRQPRLCFHKAQIRFLAWRDGPLSRNQIAQTLNLNLPTISNCVSALINEEQILEQGHADSTGGRKAQLLDINPTQGCVIGLTFSSRGVASAWADLKANVHNVKSYPFVPSQGREKALETLYEAAGHQLRDTSRNAAGRPVVQVGVGLSGLLNVQAGISHAFPRFDEWVDVPLRDLLEQRFGIPVVMDNHIAAVALTEHIFGKCRGIDNTLYIQLGPGLGVGIIIGGQIYRGSRLTVGEFGHTTITEDGPICYCGNYGCLESMASDYALIQQAELALRESVNTRILEFSSEPNKITLNAIFRAAQAGDRLANNLVEKVGRMLGTAIANLVNLFGPETIILGGTMAQAGEILLNPLCQTLRGKSLARMESDLKVSTSSFGDDEAIKGALTLALFEYLSRDIEARIPNMNASLMNPPE